MKGFLLFATLLLISLNILAQRNAYFPNGRKIPFKLTSINALKDSLKIFAVEAVYTTYGEVFYKKFTNVPAFIIFNKKDEPLRIPEMLKKFNYNKYLYSYDYYYDLKSYLDSSKLTKSFILKNFGYPDGIGKEYIDTASNWYYRKRNLHFEMTDSAASKVNVTNFRAIDTYGFAISEYNITGEDYSIGFDITLMNIFPSRKTIKYIYFNVTAKNPVKDIIGTKTVRGVGPIDYLDPASYSFEDVFYSQTAQYLILNSIKFQFMDGTFKIFTKAQIDAATMIDWEEYGKQEIN